MNARQKKFVAAYLVSGNARDAARKAGYNGSDSTVSKQADFLMHHPAVKAAIEEKLNKIEEKAIVTKEWVLLNLKEVAERCMQKVPVMVFDRAEKEMVQKTDEQGNDVWEFDSAGANKALELIGRHLAMFTDKIALSDSLEKLLAGSNPPREKE